MFNAILIKIFDLPLLLFAVSVLVLFLSVQIGAFLSRNLRPVQEDERDHLNLTINASLTLLALLIGFSFSMAVSRYDQRKNYEEEEANAIGTEYIRADFLPAADAARIRQLLSQYLDQRVQFYTSHDAAALGQIDRETEKLQAEMWFTVEHAATAQPSPLLALTVSGVNDVLNRQGYTQAAWRNRIPLASWILMLSLSICCSLLVGYSARRMVSVLFTFLPFVLAIAFFLIAEIETPRSGVVRVLPQNLISLSQSLRKQ